MKEIMGEVNAMGAYLDESNSAMGGYMQDYDKAMITDDEERAKQALNRLYSAHYEAYQFLLARLEKFKRMEKEHEEEIREVLSSVVDLTTKLIQEHSISLNAILDIETS